MDIDIQQDPIPRNSKGYVSVVIRNTAQFDPVSAVDVSTVRFGDPEDVIDGGGAVPVHKGHAQNNELLLHFPIPDTGFEGDEDQGKILGRTQDGRAFSGVDGVTFGN